MLKTMTADWKERVRPILQLYVDRLPGALLEEKEFSLAWHYRRADPEQASLRAKELLDDLAGYTRNIDVQVFEGNKVIEVRNSGINKGTAALEWLAGRTPEFILGIGDDWTDEDLFRALPPTAFSVRVGVANTAARFYLINHTAVRRMLRELSEVRARNPAGRPRPNNAMSAPTKLAKDSAPEPFWYKSGVIYEVHVRAFYDADGDGTGDFRGLTEKLDYIKDLGVTAIWLLPFYPSPLKDDGYDIADYCDVHPMYGTLGGFQNVSARGPPARAARHHRTGAEPHVRPASVVSARPPRPARQPLAQFLCLERRTRKNTGTRRVIFKDVEVSNWTLDPVAGAYFWHRFFSHQPDLNFDNPEVHASNVQGGGFLAGPRRGRPAAGCGAISL